ncbi:MAG: isoprenyl transferase [Phototrophicales bacterium]|nr:MAG: isoprenyl transferase [Phototrophicales bacterium]
MDNVTTQTQDKPIVFESPVPKHVGFIMDGNGRWAKARGLRRSEGHRQGVENLKEILEACGEFGIKYVTIYAFSTENWNRPQAEVSFLLSIIDYYIERELDNLDKQGVQLRHIGELDGLAPRLQRKIQKAIEQTRNNDRLILNVAFNYGGRAEIVRAVKQIVAAGIPAEEITEQTISQHLYTAFQPDPDLIIRTGGELRLSNFLIWQATYAEYYSTPVFWPDFNREELRKALEHYCSRERRFGGVKDEE